MPKSNSSVPPSPYLPLLCFIPGNGIRPSTGLITPGTESSLCHLHPIRPRTLLLNPSPLPAFPLALGLYAWAMAAQHPLNALPALSVITWAASSCLLKGGSGTVPSLPFPHPPCNWNSALRSRFNKPRRFLYESEQRGGEGRG